AGLRRGRPAARRRLRDRRTARSRALLGDDRVPLRRRPPRRRHAHRHFTRAARRRLRRPVRAGVAGGAARSRFRAPARMTPEPPAPRQEMAMQRVTRIMIACAAMLGATASARAADDAKTLYEHGCGRKAVAICEQRLAANPADAEAQALL